MVLDLLSCRSKVGKHLDQIMIVVVLGESFELSCYNVGSCYVEMLPHCLAFKLQPNELI